ncbi:hypothetical protein Syun_014704 [Stephania yunnanensis]|uniref:Uncharacterized protein n=1 Tax=Stephania yunnanensis TaxID=152371 RepID=A0AAP0JK57_9MAGN
MSTQTPDTSIDEDVVYLEVVLEVKGRVYELRSQGYHRNISLGESSSSRGQAYGPHELEELQRDHQRLQKTLLKERMERQEQMWRDKMERQEENREMYVHRDGKLLKALGIDDILGFDWLASPAPEAMIRTLEVRYAHEVLDEDAKHTSPIGFQVSEIPLDLDGKRSPS